MFKEEVLKTPYGQIAFRRSVNTDKPKLLALHGWLDNCASFELIAPHLQNHDWVALDLPGHGLSEHKPPGTFYYLIESLPLLDFLLSALGWKECSLLGHSMGGAISTLYAAARPERIRKMVLLENIGPLTVEASEAPLRTQKFLDQCARPGPKKLPVYADWREAWKARNMVSPVSEEPSRPLIERALKPFENGWTWRSDPRLTLETPLRLTESHVLEYLSGIQCPTLGIKAKTGYPFPEAIAKTRARQIKHFSSIELDGGHHLHIDHPETVGPAIAKFLDAN